MFNNLKKMFLLSDAVCISNPSSESKGDRTSIEDRLDFLSLLDLFPMYNIHFKY